MSRYFVTGGAGFIGSHLVERLLAGGDSVVALDDLSTGRAANVAHLARERGFQLVVGSAADARLVNRLTGACDAVVHLAAAVGVELVRADPLGTLRVNAAATAAVLDAAARHGRPALVASSSEVYGYRARVPMREDHERVLGAAGDPRAAYAVSKMHDECLVAAYAREHGLPFVAVRLFNTTGPRQRPDTGMVLPRFTSSALAGRPLRVFGDGGQTRCFAHVNDVVDALYGLLGRPDLGGEVFNIGSTEEVTILALAHRVVEAVGTSAAVDLVEYPDEFDEPRRRVPDIAKIHKAIGWAPSRTLDATIADLVDSQACGLAPAA